jgi:hypothetical protein
VLAGWEPQELDGAVRETQEETDCMVDICTHAMHNIFREKSRYLDLLDLLVPMLYSWQRAVKRAGEIVAA